MRKTDAELAQLSYASYFTPKVFPIYDTGKDTNICYGILPTREETVIAFRGSLVLRDWIRDAEAFAEPLDHDAFGPIHPGFFKGMENMFYTFIHQIDASKPVTITGHSLGAARAAILTALFVQIGFPAKQLRRVTFGEPKPGFAQFAQYISGVEARSYRNTGLKQHDPVTDMPLTIMAEKYQHSVSSLNEVTAEPTPDIIHDLEEFSWHHIALYVKAMSA